MSGTQEQIDNLNERMSQYEEAISSTAEEVRESLKTGRDWRKTAVMVGSALAATAAVGATVYAVRSRSKAKNVTTQEAGIEIQ